jgi:cephalosporin-C deacetylase
VFAAYNHLHGEKDIRIYEFNDHEGGQNYQTLAKMKFLRELWG